MQFLHRDSVEQFVEPGFSKGLTAAALILFAVILPAGYPDVAPLSIAISEFITESGRAWSNIMALNIIATLPLMVLFIFLQRWVVQGITAGAVK